MTLGFLWLRFTTLEEFDRGEIAERLVRAHGLVDVFPAAQLGIEIRDVPALRDHLVEDESVRPARSAWGNATEAQTGAVTLLTSPLEFGGELTEAIDWQGGDGRRHALHQRVEKVSGGQRSCTVMVIIRNLFPFSVFASSTSFALPHMQGRARLSGPG